MAKRLVSLAVAALVLVSCAKDSDLTVVAATVKLTEKPDATTAEVSATGLGARFKGKRGKKGWWKLTLPDGKEAFAPPEALAPYPIVGQPRWVVAPFAGQLAEPDLASRTITAKYEIGTELQIVGGAPWLPPEIAAVIGSGTVIGFVPVRTLGDREPKAGDLLAAGREALLAGRPSEALMQGKRALILDPKHAGARALVAALHEANGDAEAEGMQDALVVPPTAPPAVTVNVGDAAFVGVASLELRKAKGDTTEVLTRLPINTPVTVRAIDGTWTQVAWKGQPDVGANIDVYPFEAKTAAPKPAVATATTGAAIALEEVVVDDDLTVGWLLGGHLSAVEQESTAIAGVARQRVAAGKTAEAVELFERAVTLAPSNLELTRELLATAIQADRYLVAAYAALALARGGEDLGGLEVVTMDLFFGCRGDRYEAERVSGSDAPEADEALEDNACVYDVDSEPPCEPCNYDGHDDHNYDEHDDAGDGEGEEEAPELSPEETERRHQIEQAEAAALAAQEAVEQAERDAAAEKEQREREVDIAQHELYVTKIATAYPGGYWVYLEIRNRQAGRVAGAKIQIYQVSSYSEGGSPSYSPDSVVVGEVELPPLGPNASVGLWFEVPQYTGMEYGVVRMADVDTAREAIAKGLDGASEHSMPPHHSVLVAKPDCSCGGC